MLDCIIKLAIKKLF